MKALGAHVFKIQFSEALGLFLSYVAVSKVAKLTNNPKAGKRTNLNLKS